MSVGWLDSRKRERHKLPPWANNPHFLHRCPWKVIDDDISVVTIPALSTTRVLFLHVLIDLVLLNGSTNVNSQQD